MKREDVKNKIPGITDEQLDWLMQENGSDITREKSAANALQAQVATAQDGLKAFGAHKPEDFAAAQQQIAQLQQQMKEQADGYAFDSALNGAIRDAKGRDVKAIRGMLDLDRLKSSKDRGADIQAALKALAEEKAWAFEAAEPNATGMIVNTGAEHGTGGSAENDGGLSGVDQNFFSVPLSPDRNGFGGFFLLRKRRGLHRPRPKMPGTLNPARPGCSAAVMAGIDRQKAFSPR